MAEQVLAGSRSGEHDKLRLVERALFGGCGAALLIGFFMPWFKVSTLLNLSGLGLLLSGGEMVGMLAGSNRLLLVLVPLLGAGLLGGAILGSRVTRLGAVVGSALFLLAGFLILLRFFLSSTGTGMWLVVFSALLALSVGLIALGRSQRS
jgi:hypothetical protein